MPAPAEKGVELLPKTTEIQSRHYRFNSICMKPFYLLLTAMLTWLSLIPIAQAQTAEGGCTSVELIDGVPSYPNNAYIDPYLVSCGYCDGCNKMLNPQYYQSPKTAQFLLQILDGESWSNVGGWQTSSEFDDIDEHGWYRVAVRVPQYLSAFCTGGWIKIYNYLNQHVGYEGEWASTIYSNIVTVGETEQSDVTWEFIDPTPNHHFNYLEEVKINTTGTINYDNWWVAIFEYGGQERYWSNGWTGGLIPGNEINLSELSQGIFNEVFEPIPNYYYLVQFAISSICDTEWTNQNDYFYVCPSGMPCRIAGQDEIIVSPNPVSTFFSIPNLGFSENYRLTLTDLAGKTVKSFVHSAQISFDIADLPDGLYILNIWDDNTRIHTVKLSVLK